MGRANDVPCDVDKCKYDPSPGDLGPDGCGLMAENAFAVWFYNKWKRFGPVAFELVHLEVNESEAAGLLDKLVLIDEWAPEIARVKQKREQDREAAQRPRRPARTRRRR